jgi:two-component system sensor histidine kinase KdpD
MAYHGTTLPEMDLDAILARRPQLVLVDELAHSDAPGMRHLKRYQDVEELLEAGINVYTTVNIQHLESLKDVVQQITGVIVRETVPDRIFDEADEIELVDLPTDELLNRLREGKVYVPEQAARAMEKFFRKGNLSALRELSLRRTAGRVDSQMVNYMRTKSIPGPWPAGERIMVCISSHPLGERLVRVGRRLADDLNAEWYVVFVETPGHLHMGAQNRLRIEQNLHLAEELGARVEHITSESVAGAGFGLILGNTYHLALRPGPAAPALNAGIPAGGVPPPPGPPRLCACRWPFRTRPPPPGGAPAPGGNGSNGNPCHRRARHAARGCREGRRGHRPAPRGCA